MRHALTTSIAFPAIVRAQSLNSRVSVAVMGVSRTSTGAPGRGTELALGLAGIPNVDVSYLCDVDERYLAKAMEAVKQKGARPKAQKDFRTVLEDKTVDALVVAAPDHWHAPAAILACAAGKHVYVETPSSHNPAEGDMLIAAAQKYSRLVQHGTQRRSWPVIQEALAKLKSGAIGRILLAKAEYFNDRISIGKGHNARVPPELDWDLWQGPAPDRPFHDNYVPHNWHWFWHWGTGEMGNNGVQLLDLCIRGSGMDNPARVSCAGGKLRYDDDQETPDTQLLTIDSATSAGPSITVELRSWAARTFNDPKFDVAFYGEGGSLLINGSSYAIYDLAGKEIGRGAGTGGNEAHLRNFIEAIQQKAKPVADIAEANPVVLLAHFANIALRSSRTINMDLKNKRITDDGTLSKYWRREYREGWAPVV